MLDTIFRNGGERKQTHDELRALLMQARTERASLRAMLDPEAIDRRAKDDQNALVERHGGREAALRMGYPGETPTAQKFSAPS